MYKSIFFRICFLNSSANSLQSRRTVWATFKRTLKCDSGFNKMILKCVSSVWQTLASTKWMAYEMRSFLSESHEQKSIFSNISAQTMRPTRAQCFWVDEERDVEDKFCSNCRDLLKGFKFPWSTAGPGHPRDPPPTRALPDNPVIEDRDVLRQTCHNGNEKMLNFFVWRLNPTDLWSQNGSGIVTNPISLRVIASAKKRLTKQYIVLQWNKHFGYRLW